MAPDSDRLLAEPMSRASQAAKRTHRQVGRSTTHGRTYSTASLKPAMQEDLRRLWQSEHERPPVLCLVRRRRCAVAGKF